HSRQREARVRRVAQRRIDGGGCRKWFAAASQEVVKNQARPMNDIALLVVRVLLGGTLVVAFALLSDALKPKTFAGLFSGAPSVATASLLVTGLATGAAKDEKYAMGMIGAAISLVAGVIGMKFGPRLGGVLLGFPAILPASLTLIEKKEGKEQASVDSIGAGLGAVAMIAFAVVVSLTVVSWGVLASLAA